MSRYQSQKPERCNPQEYEDECSECGGKGWVVGDCFEDTCCCADPVLEHGLVRCGVCN